MRSVAALLEYPTAQAPLLARQACDSLSARCPEAAAALKPYADYAQANARARLEEVFAELFDFNPACAPEIGWHLYGEDYKRGTFLVRMRALMRELGVAEDQELPDHLSHVLEVYSRLEPERAKVLAQNNLLPALEKMRAAAAGNPYDAVLAALEALIRGGIR